MSLGRPHMSVVTLGVSSLERAIAFYEALGLRRADFDSPRVAFFDMGGTALSLFGWDALAEDADLPPQGMGFRGVSLAWNQPSREAVDKAIAHAVVCGARLVKAPKEVFWGGYSGYIADPDGHLWEIAHNPGWLLRENGAMDLPAPRDNRP